jgi:hypothetical protein
MLKEVATVQMKVLYQHSVGANSMYLGPSRETASHSATQEFPTFYRRALRLYSSPSIIRMIKSRRMRWAGHVARMGEKDIGGKARR